MQLDNFQKVLEKTFLVALLTISLASCQDLTKGPIKLQDLPQSEVFISKSYNSKFGTVVGSRNLYVVYGTTSLKEKAGTGLAPDHKFYFRIKDLLEKWKEIDDPRVQKAIAKQEATIIKKLELQNGQPAPRSINP